jgi:hypothetical protein
MTAATSAPRSAPPPRALMRWAVNPVVRAVLRSPAGRWTGGLVLLELTGRRTGRRLRIPVVGHPVDGVLHVSTDAPWAANFRGGAPVQVTSGARTWSGRGVLLEDPVETAQVLRAVLATSNARAMGLVLPADRDVTDDELCALRRIVRISPAS